MIYYFDNCATTQLDESLMDTIKKYNCDSYFNPSSLHHFSIEIARDIADARANIADILNVKSNNILFTSCGTEGDNTAIANVVKTNKGNIVTSNVEHAAVYNTLKTYIQRGIEVRAVETRCDGSIDPSSLISYIDKQTTAVVLMHVNNETGAVNDIEQLCRVAKSINPDIKFICDGVQAVGKIKIDLTQLGVDYYTFSGHKFHAPKGVGGLYVKNPLKQPLLIGGGQENGFRSGTENIASIIAMSQALSNADSLIYKLSHIYESYKKIIIQTLTECDIDFFVINADNPAPNILSLAIADIKSQVLMQMLEMQNIIIGTGSACSSKHHTSRIVDAINLAPKYKSGVTRICFSKYNSFEQVEYLATRMAQQIKQLVKTIKG